MKERNNFETALFHQFSAKPGTSILDKWMFITRQLCNSGITYLLYTLLLIVSQDQFAILLTRLGLKII